VRTHHYDVRLVTRADKRARQKERTRQAREAREAAAKRQRRKSIGIGIGISLVVVAIAIGVTALIGGDDDKSSAAGNPSTTTAAKATLPEGCTDAKPADNPNRPTSFPEPPPMTIDPAKTYTAKLSTSCGDITIALDAKNAPTSVNNFVYLAKQGFYDGLTWPRAAKGFVIQTGSPSNDQSGGPGYSVQAELPPGNAYPSGAVAWAKSGQEASGTAGSQFFIVTGDPAGLTAEYGYIGVVSAGLENAQKIESLAPASGDGPPTIPMYLTKVEITES
jgi:cyclophilin family peptidyl-prolyl cis-trans isomerase